MVFVDRESGEGKAWCQEVILLIFETDSDIPPWNSQLHKVTASVKWGKYLSS